MHKVIAFQIAEDINIKEFRQNYTGVPVLYDLWECLYKSEFDEYCYVLRYGVVAFINYNEVKMSEFIEFIKPYCKNTLNEKLREELNVQVIPQKYNVGNQEVIVPELRPEIVKIIMLNVGQSVAIDYFANQAEELLEDTQKYTFLLEKHGRLNISGKNFKRYIGKSLNLKNRIFEHLYILDSPDETWEDEYLSRLHNDLKRTFDITIRHKSIIEDLEIIKENLDLFKDLLHHQKSNMLEWIIIALILVEVVNMIIEKLF